MKWTYHAETLPGNFHSAVAYINEHHPEWDVITMDFNGGNYTIVVYRTPHPFQKGRGA